MLRIKVSIKNLGGVIRLVFLHGALAQAGLLTFAATAMRGLLCLVVQIICFPGQAGNFPAVVNFLEGEYIKELI